MCAPRWRNRTHGPNTSHPKGNPTTKATQSQDGEVLQPTLAAEPDFRTWLQLRVAADRENCNGQMEEEALIENNGGDWPEIMTVMAFFIISSIHNWLIFSDYRGGVIHPGEVSSDVRNSWKDGIIL